MARRRRRVKPLATIWEVSDELWVILKPPTGLLRSSFVSEQIEAARLECAAESEHLREWFEGPITPAYRISHAHLFWVYFYWKVISVRYLQHMNRCGRMAMYSIFGSFLEADGKQQRPRKAPDGDEWDLPPRRPGRTKVRQLVRYACLRLEKLTDVE